MVQYLTFLFTAWILWALLCPKYKKLYIGLIVLGLGILAYHIEVTPTSDLVRHFRQIDLFRNGMGMDYVFDGLNPGTKLYFHAVSFFPDNRFHPCISTMIIYYFMLKLADNACKDLGLPNYVDGICIAAILLCYNFFLACNCIRMWLVFSIFLYCAYEELVRGRHKHLAWLVYICLVFYHYGALTLIAARFVPWIINRIKKINILSIVLVLAFVGTLAVVLNSSYFIQFVLPRLEGYENYAVRGRWQTIVGYMRFTMVLCMVPMLMKTSNQGYKDYFWMLIGMLFVTVLQYSNYVMVLRFGDAIITAASVPIAKYYKDIIPAKPKGRYVVTVSQCTFFLLGFVTTAAIFILDYRNHLHFVF